jgi:hypothetical protein
MTLDQIVEPRPNLADVLGRPLATMIVLLAASWVEGCGSSPAADHDASEATAPHDASAPRDAANRRDGPAPLDARDAAVSDGPGPALRTISCAGVPCVLGQQYCYTFEDLRPDAGGTMTAACLPIPADCAGADSGALCGCVLQDHVECQQYTSCVLELGTTLSQVDCQLTATVTAPTHR